MPTNIVRTTTLLLLVILTLSACTLLSPTPPPDRGPGAIYTQAAQTVMVQLTQLAADITPTPAAATPTQADITEVATPGDDTPSPTATSVPPSATAQPTSPTPVPASPTPIPCDLAQFVSDVTVADGSVFTPKSIFTKVWRLKNIGDCTWTKDYDLVFVSGDEMKGPGTVGLPKSVAPGETIDLSVELIAPSQKGSYRGYWELRNTANQLFGTLAGADRPFWVDIKVVEPGDYVYDFGLNYCQAEWYSDAGHLECPGTSGSSDGFVVLLTAPTIEKGRKENEIALWTRPQDENKGWIRGEYPEIKISDGDHFKAVVGCLDGATHCDVTFQLNYRAASGTVQTLWQQEESYDGHYTKVDVDLSLLAGEKIEFLLTVLSNGSPKDDQAFWLLPRIVEVN